MGLPVPDLHHGALADEITTLYAHINAATARLLELIASFDEQGLYARYNALSTAHWLNWSCGIGLAAGREKVRVARALRELPALAAAFRAGVLSYSKVRAITRVATPACEATLLDMARHATAAQTERIMRNYRQALSLEGAPERRPPERQLSCFWDEHGCLSIRGCLSPEQGSVFLKALERALGQVAEPCPEDEVPVAARRADALVVLSEQTLSEAAGGSTADRFQVAVHVSAETLRREVEALDPAGDDLPVIDGGPVIGPARARRLCCDGSVIPLLESASGEVLAIGRKTRTVPPALRRALKRRDGGCRFPGCTQRHWVDAHHIRHWVHGGETAMDNLILLCRRHHGAVHEGGFTIRRHRDADGLRVEFVDPRGRVVPATAEDLTAGSWQTLVADVSAETPGIDAATPRPDCDGRQPDYDHIAWWMVGHLRR